MKERFIPPELDILFLDEDDIIRTSPVEWVDWDDDDDDNSNDPIEWKDF